MQAIFHGHSFVEILTAHPDPILRQEGKNLRILIDPFVEHNTYCDLSIDDLKDKDIYAIIITHGHDDHIGCAIELCKKYDIQLITSYELGEYFIDKEKISPDLVSKHGIGGSVDYEFFKVKFFQAFHGGGISDLDHGYTTVAAGVILTVGGHQIYHAGDTGLFGDMKMLHEFYEIDIAFLPIGDRYTMGVDDAVIAASWIKPKYAVPIHYNTRPKIKADDLEFARLVMLGGHAVPKVLKPGQAVVME